MKVHPLRGLITRVVPLLSACSALAGCQEGPLAPRGVVAFVERELLYESLVAMLLVVVPVLVLANGVAWWFRAGNRRATYLPDWEYSGKIEFAIWIIPLLLVAFLGTLSWAGAHMQDPYKPLVSDKPVLRVQVVSLDWKWVFIYPDQHVATINELVIPAGTPVHFDLTSGTVMNSFFVPQLAGQIYTMAGMRTQLSLLADAPGTYQGFSAQFSGDGFSDMHFDARVMSEADFEAWMSATRQHAGTLDEGAYEQLASAHARSGVRQFGNVAPGFFDTVIARAAPDTAAPGRP